MGQQLHKGHKKQGKCLPYLARILNDVEAEFPEKKKNL